MKQKANINPRRDAKAKPAPGKRLEVPLSAIREDHDTQSRESINLEVVGEYAEAEDLPPIVVFGGSGKYWIGDGWHRYLAAKKAGREKIAALVHPGGKDEAIEHACGANDQHGLRRNQKDVRRSIKLMLVKLAHKNYSGREVARRVLCDHKTVEAVRADLIAIGEIPQSGDGRRTEIRNGKEVVRDVSANQRPRAPQPENTIGHSHGALSNLTAAPTPKKVDIPEPIVVSRAESSDPDHFPIDVLERAEEERRNEAAPPSLVEATWEEANADAPDEEEEEAEPEAPEGPAGDEAEPDAWIHALDLYRDLPEVTRPRFAHDCRLWKALEDHFRAFQKAARPLLDAARQDAGKRVKSGEYIPLDNTLSFFDLTVRYQKLRHPRAWSRCGHCKGEGQGGFGEPCGGCRGKGYRVD